MEAKKETIPDQKYKATKESTLNWINHCFEGIDVITHKTGKKTNYVFVRLDDFAQKVLLMLGNDYVLISLYLVYFVPNHWNMGIPLKISFASSMVFYFVVTL